MLNGWPSCPWTGKIPERDLELPFKGRHHLHISCNGLFRPSCKDSLDMCLASAAFLSHRGRFYNPSLVSLTLSQSHIPETARYCCLSRMEMAFLLKNIFLLALWFWWFSSLLQLFFNSCLQVGSLTRWVILLRSPLPLFHLASGLSLNFTSHWTQELAPVPHSLVFLFSSNCAFCISFGPTCSFSL